jgi:tungstate transport system ATP-binding protein
MNTASTLSDLPIRIDAVDVDFGAVSALQGISLFFETGMPTVIVGPNGSGKTTLLRVAMGLIAPARGSVSWGERGEPLRSAFVFQRPVMLQRSALGNLRYALASIGMPHNKRAQRAAELLAWVQLGDLADRPARGLSAGEQQRLALARALALNPQVLILDEPTASLDPAATQAIEEIVRTVSTNGVKVIMSTHDLSEARRIAGDIVLLHRGALVERSQCEKFFTAPATSLARRFINGELLL